MKIHLSSRLKDMRAGKVPKVFKKSMLENETFFPGTYGLSKAQIAIMINEKKQCGSRQWSKADYCIAMQLRCYGTKALDFVGKFLIPLPVYSTLRKRFGFMHLTPGFLKPHCGKDSGEL